MYDVYESRREIEQRLFDTNKGKELSQAATDV
jgi:hypothetical protein